MPDYSSLICSHSLLHYLIYAFAQCHFLKRLFLTILSKIILSLISYSVLLPRFFLLRLLYQYLMQPVYLCIWFLFVFPFKMQTPLGHRLFVYVCTLSAQSRPSIWWFSDKDLLQEWIFKSICSKRYLTLLRLDFLICKINIMTAISTEI